MYIRRSQHLCVYVKYDQRTLLQISLREQKAFLPWRQVNESCFFSIFITRRLLLRSLVLFSPVSIRWKTNLRPMKFARSTLPHCKDNRKRFSASLSLCFFFSFFFYANFELDLRSTVGELESSRTHRMIVPSGVWKSEGALSTKGWIVSGSRGTCRWPPNCRPRKHNTNTKTQIETRWYR